MEKVKRGERLIAMTRVRASNPIKVIASQVFCDQFKAA